MHALLDSKLDLRICFIPGKLFELRGLIYYFHGFNHTSRQISPLQKVSEDGELQELDYRKLFDVAILSDVSPHAYASISEDFFRITVVKYNIPIF